MYRRMEVRMLLAWRGKRKGMMIGHKKWNRNTNERWKGYKKCASDVQKKYKMIIRYQMS
jgi:hypothetical protein